MAAVALLFCVATSDVDEAQPSSPPEEIDPDEELDEIEPEFSAQVVLHNALGVDAVVRVRTLGVGVDIDCEAIAADPGALLGDALFSESQTWTVPATSNLPISSPQTRPCHAARLEGEGFAPRLVFWSASRAAHSYPQGGLPEAPVISLEVRGTATALVGDPALLYTPEPGPRASEQCTPQSDGRRLDWSVPVPTGGGRVVEAEFGPDGCFSIRLQGAEEMPQPWFLCVSEDAWPFELGDELQIETLYDSGLEGIALTGAGFEQREGARLVVSRGTELPPHPTLTYQSLEFAPDCGLDVHEGCATVTRALALQVSNGTEVVELGTSTAVAELLDGDERALRIEARTLQRRLVLDPECAGGPDVLGLDLELLLTTL